MAATEERFRHPILRTKLHRPRLPADAVSRARLLELMEGAAGTPFTLVSAPAGYGKSVLVSQWVESRGLDSAWLSLDKDEGDLASFLSYLLVALDRVCPGACARTGELLEAPELPPVASLARRLTNELDALDETVVLVLDDFHTIPASSPVAELVQLVLEHPPEPLRLVIITRNDPPLALARLRANGRLTEIRVRDLRFSPEESAEFVTRGNSFELSAGALEHLEKELEGWAVGLRLVAETLRHGADPESFLRGLHGGFAQIQEYLMREVLAAQPPEVRRGLLVSALFDRFRAELLDAVSDADSDTPATTRRGRELVAEVVRRNLFAIPLDAEGGWVRYHHLFGEFLRELARQLPREEVNAIHRRASQWFESRRLIPEAIRHALAAGEPVLGAEIVERQRLREMDLDRTHIVQSWLDLLPPGIEQDRPGLLLARAQFLQDEHRFLEIPPVIARVESLLEDENASEALRAELEIRSGMLDVWQHFDGESAVRRMEWARGRLPSSSKLEGDLECSLAAGRQILGQRQRALQELDERLLAAHESQADYKARLLLGRAAAGMLGGELPEVRLDAQRLAATTASTGRVVLEAWAHYLLGSAELHGYELGDASRSFALAATRSRIFNRRMALDSLAGLVWGQQVLGHEDEAESTMRQLEDLTRKSGPHHVDVAHSCRARLQLLRGELDAASGWARTLDREVHPSSVFFLLEVPLLTQARVWIESAASEELELALTRLHELAEMCRRYHFNGQGVEVAALEAVALEKSQRSREALDVLAQAIEDAAPRGWVRPFIEAGPVMVELLDRLSRLERSGEDVARLLAACAEAAGGGAVEVPPRPAAAQVAGHLSMLLSNRELDVLELLAKRYHDKEIASRLGVSAHTVKGHLKQVYQKLGVHGRREAVAKASSLGIL